MIEKTVDQIKTAEEGASSSVLQWIKRLVVGCKIEVIKRKKKLLETHFTVSGITRWQTIKFLKLNKVMHNTSESNSILLTITLVLRKKCKYNKVKSLYCTLSSMKENLNNIKNNWSVRESRYSWGRRAGPWSYCRCPRRLGHRHQHGVQPLVRLDPSLHLQHIRHRGLLWRRQPWQFSDNCLKNFSRS